MRVFFDRLSEVLLAPTSRILQGDETVNLTFIIIFALYLLILILISVFDLKKTDTFSEYATAGKSQGLMAVTMTLLATVVGASTTIGITDTVNSIGFPGIWWLLFGAIGLLLQSFILSEKVRKMDADTLPDLAGKLVGKPAEVLLSIVIVVSWVGIIAGQFVALSSIISFATGISSKYLVAVVSFIVIIYTMSGGQLSVVKTDKIQLILILIGITVCCGWLYFIKGGNVEPSDIEFLNKDYRPINLINQFFVIGGVYFLGPDIMSRNFLAKDEQTARKSALIAGLLLAVFSFLITMIGLWVRINVTPDELGGGKALMFVAGIVPKGISMILMLGLVSAILSSTDTCIINASTIFVKDILRKDSVNLVRVTVLIMGVISLVLALAGRGDIMSLLSGAYSIYTPGIIFPLFIAIIVNDSKKLRLGVWMAAVITGGLFGLAGTYFMNLLSQTGVPEGVLTYLPLFGMLISLIISISSIKMNKK